MQGGKLVIVALVWMTIIGIGVMGYKWLYRPAQEQAVKNEADRKLKEKVQATSGTSNYKHKLAGLYDGFSGYGIIRSQEFKNELSRKGILIDWEDDGADYDSRLKALKDGDVNLAVFTWDALIKSSAKINDTPATGVLVIDETQGADAMVGYKSAFPNVDALNDPETKFVLTGDSPSETLVRVLIAKFNLDRLSDEPFVFMDSAEEVYKKYRTASPNEKQVFVLWEPYVTKCLENPNMHVIIDSSRFRGYIVDVLVVNKDYLYKHGDVVSDIVKSYFRAGYANKNKINQLILDDARELGTPVTKVQAENLAKGIWFKNTQENYAHFGLDHGKALQHVEDMIINLTDVLVESGSISGDPTNGDPTLLYYDPILKKLNDSNFHPGISAESIRNRMDNLQKLSDNDWEGLIPVGTLDVPQLGFKAGSSKLSIRSNASLNKLIETLKTFPQYYVVVRGDGSRRGDIKANKDLALERAKSAAGYLTKNGIHQNRVRAVAVDPTGTPSVNFILGETSY